MPPCYLICLNLQASQNLMLTVSSLAQLRPSVAGENIYALSQALTSLPKL